MRIHLNTYISVQEFISKLVNGLNICNVKEKGKGRICRIFYSYYSLADKSSFNLLHFG